MSASKAGTINEVRRDQYQLNQNNSWSTRKYTPDPNKEIVVAHHETVDGDEAVRDLRAVFVDKTMSLEAYLSKYPDADILAQAKKSV